MKNFERISINSEKLLKNEDLTNLRGGILENTTCLKCTVDEEGKNVLGRVYTICPGDDQEAVEICQANFPGSQYAFYTCGQNCND
jgi:hypothetical protein